MNIHFGIVVLSFWFQMKKMSNIASQALESDEFAQTSLEGRDAAVGSIPRDKLNVNG